MSKGFTREVELSSSGCSCSYYAVGLKIYKHERERDEAFFRQRHAHAHGIAPFAIERIEVDGKPAYLTEVADLLHEWPMAAEVAVATEKHEAAFGFMCGDFHRGNIGYLHDELVFIDFGHHGYNEREQGVYGDNGPPYLEVLRNE